MNADDYGYSEGVSRGILEAARRGVVTAVGILANSPLFEDHLDELLSAHNVDMGVHLNLTAGRPLTRRLENLLERTGGEFPRNKFQAALSILARRIGIDLVEEEWDAQIRRCRDANIGILFLNSHEHLHMLPPLFRLTRRLAEKHGIPNIRHTSAEWFGFPQSSNIPREMVLLFLDYANRIFTKQKAPVVLGASRSGRIDLSYLERRLESLALGGVYELMCHPGRSVDCEVVDRRLAAYHDWDGELNALLAAKEHGLFDSRHVRLIRYRDLDTNAGTPETKGGQTEW